MAIPIPIPPFPILILLLLIPSTIQSLNITSLLSTNPNLSDFTSLLSTTSLPSDLTSQSPITLLVVPNPYLHPNFPPSSTSLSDVLRYHVLLQYLTLSDLHLIPPSGKLVPTLFQTTGRASSNPLSSSVNITYDPLSTTVTFHSPTSNATLLTLTPPIKTLPYNVSVISLDSLLIPYDLDLMASETRPPLGLNITNALINGHDFNVAAAMLAASGVVSEFEADEGGAGITLFVPTDEAFADLPSSVRFQSLPADKKAVVLRFHVLHSYYPLGSLERIVNPVYPTLATEQTGATKFTVNISRVNGSVAIDTGVVLASVTQTVFDQNPVAIFGVSKVLLPREYFGKDSIVVDEPVEPAPEPALAFTPGNSPEPSRLTSPPGSDLKSGSVGEGFGMLRFVGWSLMCIVLCCLL